jgi:hypothetical protein
MWKFPSHQHLRIIYPVIKFGTYELNLMNLFWADNEIRKKIGENSDYNFFVSFDGRMSRETPSPYYPSL